MNTAFAMKFDFFAPLRQVLTWLLPSPELQVPAVAVRRPIERLIAPDFISSSEAHAGIRAIYQPKLRPLRVVRVLESGQLRSDVGRMVISGRMADVCAELDRLAACEAA